MHINPKPSKTRYNNRWPPDTPPILERNKLILFARGPDRVYSFRHIYLNNIHSYSLLERRRREYPKKTWLIIGWVTRQYLACGLISKWRNCSSVYSVVAMLDLAWLRYYMLRKFFGIFFKTPCFHEIELRRKTISNKWRRKKMKSWETLFFF